MNALPSRWAFIIWTVLLFAEYITESSTFLGQECDSNDVLKNIEKWCNTQKKCSFYNHIQRGCQMYSPITTKMILITKMILRNDNMVLLLPWDEKKLDRYNSYACFRIEKGKKRKNRNAQMMLCVTSLSLIYCQSMFLIQKVKSETVKKRPASWALWYISTFPPKRWKSASWRLVTGLV